MPSLYHTPHWPFTELGFHRTCLQVHSSSLIGPLNTSWGGSPAVSAYYKSAHLQLTLQALLCALSPAPFPNPTWLLTPCLHA